MRSTGRRRKKKSKKKAGGAAAAYGGGKKGGGNGGEYFAATSTGAAMPSGLTKLEVLEQRMAHLQWRKAQNDRKIKSSLQRVKDMQEHDLLAQLAHDREREKAEWMQDVVEDELNQPLEVTEEFLQRFESHQQTARDKYNRQAKHHASSLAKLKAHQEALDLQRARNAQYREKKHHLMTSTVDGLLMGSAYGGSAGAAHNSDMTADEILAGAEAAMAAAGAAVGEPGGGGPAVASP